MSNKHIYTLLTYIGTFNTLTFIKMGSAVQKSALLLCGDYMEAYETMVPLYILQSFGVSVHCVSPNRSAGDRCVMSAHDFLGLEVPIFTLIKLS